MKTKFALLVAAFAVLSVSQPLLAAGKKTDPRKENEQRRERLVSALQAVSPDALGGRLGLTIATAQAPKVVASKPTQNRLVNSTDRSPDQLDYLSWKGGKKS